MNQFVLWFNMIGFTLMFASVGLSYLVYDRNRALWLRDYIIYASAYTVWLFFATWVFFRAVYLTEPMPQLTLLFARARSIVSIVILLFGPLFFFRCGGYPIRGPVRVLILTVAAGVSAIIGTLLFVPIQLLGYLITPTFNLYLSVLSWLALRAVRKKARAPQRPMIPLLIYSGFAYALLSAFGILLPLFAATKLRFLVQAVAAGGFLFGWAVLMIGVNMRWIGRASSRRTTIPDAYLTDYAITPREEQVLALLLTGLTSSEIAAKLFVSQRTVETHIYNVYRKSVVGNRVELIAKISSYGTQ